ncbi:CrcB family protein [Actinoplanes sp. NPDC049802]|uniref:FluC/FEX family fluoride channel n=1 Tax=Actinoplanes sp. NPDC049802 TaxID=3154742 RepID=UPI0033C62E8F
MDLDVDRAALATVSAGGALGALARYGIATAWPTAPHGFPWSTWLVNVTGCFLIGVLYTRVQRRLPRLFLGAGLLGGYTTFSTAIVEVSHAGLAYLAATVAGAVAAVAAGSALAR